MLLLQPVLWPSSLAPLLTPSHQHMSSQLFSSYNPSTFLPPPHLLQNKEAELESPLQQADSVGKQEVIRQCPGKLHSGELSTARNTTEVAALQLPLGWRTDMKEQ